eukprot:3913838-Rhodomonas_salina.2
MAYSDAADGCCVLRACWPCPPLFFFCAQYGNVLSGAVCTAVEEVLEARSRNAFCCVRPPGEENTPVEI